MNFSGIGNQVKMQVILLLGTGLAVGAVAGVIASVGADNLEQTGQILVWGYLSLAIFLSIALAVSIWLSIDNDISLEEGFQPREIYRSLEKSRATTLLAGVIGTLAATVAFFFPGQAIPMLLKGYEGASVLQEAFQQLGFANFFLVMIVVIAVGLIASALGYRQIKDSLY
jgi:hypothetical protein